ncbi:hypothetical protein QFZ61_002680 [Arthrobacter sp. B3I4]|nr:hypothetical protein [Arthrobacter sp. B3I4]
MCVAILTQPTPLTGYSRFPAVPLFVMFGLAPA